MELGVTHGRLHTERIACGVDQAGVDGLARCSDPPSAILIAQAATDEVSAQALATIAQERMATLRNAGFDTLTKAEYAIMTGPVLSMAMLLPEDVSDEFIDGLATEALTRYAAKSVAERPAGPEGSH